jgi:hypothetical protein
VRFGPGHLSLYPICICSHADRLKITWKRTILKFTWLNILPGVIGSSPASYRSEYTPNIFFIQVKGSIEESYDIGMRHHIDLSTLSKLTTEQSMTLNTVGRSSHINRSRGSCLNSTVFLLDTDVTVGSLALYWLDQVGESVVIVINL